MDFEHVLVVGAGQMGGGIAQVVAASGRRVSLHDAAPGATGRGFATMRRSLEKLAEKGGADPEEVLGRVEEADDLVPADLLIEAVIEVADVKMDVFRRADEILPESAILASNTSSIPITSLAAATSRPERVIGMHFFNPVPVLKLVEDTDNIVVPGPRCGGAGRAAEEAEIGAKYAEASREERDDRLPQPRVSEPAVEQQDGLAAAGLVVPEARAVDVDRGHGATI